MSLILNNLKAQTGRKNWFRRIPDLFPTRTRKALIFWLAGKMPLLLPGENHCEVVWRKENDLSEATDLLDFYVNAAEVGILYHTGNGSIKTIFKGTPDYSKTDATTAD